MQPVDPGLVNRLAREHGTPYYLYDAGVMRKRLANRRAAGARRGVI
jgi:diaminopimelate decarboxylase